jgi:hypothetical protein
VAELMCEWILRRGLSASDVVLVHGDSKEALALFGAPDSVRLVRTAMFNAAISWKPIQPD